jgi:hypothetical protein
VGGGVRGVGEVGGCGVCAGGSTLMMPLGFEMPSASGGFCEGR